MWFSHFFNLKRKKLNVILITFFLILSIAILTILNSSLTTRGKYERFLMFLWKFFLFQSSTSTVSDQINSPIPRNNSISSSIITINNQKEMECCSSMYWDKMLSAETLTGTQLMQYFMWTNRSSCQLAHDFGGIMMKKPSGLSGQKAVCIDPQVAPIPNECLIYSFGINNEWSFDEQMEKYGCEVFAFDPSMGMDHHNHTSAIHFYNWGLSDRDKYDNISNWNMRSLSSIYSSLSKFHGYKIIDYLKIDIEYSEWIALPEIIMSGMMANKVRQLGIEVHLSRTDSLEKHRGWATILRTIERNGMVRFDSKYNPWFSGEFMKFPLNGSFGHEIAWYNSKLLHTI